MQVGNLIRVRTLKGTHFTAGLAQDHGIQVTLAPSSTAPSANYAAGFVPESLAAGRHCRSRLRSIRILSKENLAWEVWLFANGLFATADADTEKFLGRWSFAAADGVQATIGSTLDTYFHYYIDGLDVAVEDVTDPKPLGSLYLRLVNRSAASKSAGGAGELVVELGLEPSQGI